MKSFADIKRRIIAGARLLTVKNTYVERLTGTARTVTKVQTNGFWYRVDGEEKDGWMLYGKAADFTVIDPDTFRVQFNRVGMPDHYVEIRFLPAAAV